MGSIENEADDCDWPTSEHVLHDIQRPVRLTPRLSCGARAPQRLRPRPPARRQLQPVVRPDVDYGRFEISEEPRSDRRYLAPQVREMVCGTARAEDPEAHTA